MIDSEIIFYGRIDNYVGTSYRIGLFYQGREI